MVNLSHNNLKESLRNEVRTSGGFDLIIDAGKLSIFFIDLLTSSLVNSLVQDLSNNDFECYSVSALSIRYKKVCRFINMLEEFSNENSEQSSSSNLDINRIYISQYHQYSLFHSLSKY